jgi:hypothetical protein
VGSDSASAGFLISCELSLLLAGLDVKVAWMPEEAILVLN